MLTFLRKFKRCPKAGQVPETRPQLTALANNVLRDTHIEYRFRNAGAKASKLAASDSRSSLSTNVTPRSSQVVVEVSRPENFRRQDYVPIPNSPKRRKTQHENKETEAALRLQTQKEQGAAAVVKLQDFVAEVFEAQDMLEVAVANGEQLPQTVFFEPPDEEDDFKLRLSSATLGQLQSQTKQLLSLDRLDDVSTGYIKRLQQMCDSPIDAAQGINLRLDGLSSEEDLQAWRSRTRKAENGVLSALLYLQLAVGCKKDENTASAEILRCIPNILVNVFESCLIPVLEARPDIGGTEVFANARSLQEELRRILEHARKAIDLLASACVEVQTASDCINATEFLSAKLIFVQSGSTEKSAALGAQVYERVRKQAMASLARIYAAFSGERSPILDEALSSLDKLPSSSRSARQYKLKDGMGIMLVSALFLQLVQTASLEGSQIISRPKSRTRRSKISGKSGIQSEDDSDDSMHLDKENEEYAETGNDIYRLDSKASELYDPAAKTAQEIVLYMVDKASKVSKTGDSPYRNVLDMFVEDLVSLLSLPEWPAAELLLRILATRASNLAYNAKTASVKNMSLELLGLVGSAISNCRAQALRLSSSTSFGSDQSDLASHLIKLTNDHFTGGLSSGDAVGEESPFAITARYYAMGLSTSLRARSARSFFLAQYAKVLCRTRVSEDFQGDFNEKTRTQANDLLEQIAEAASEDCVMSPTTMTAAEATLAYLLAILNLGLCRQYESIVRTLLESLNSDQAQVRSRSLKSVVTILDEDPSLLDRDPTLADNVFRCASDDSAMVRDAALSLIAKFIVSKPALEEKGIKRLLECAGDSKVGVQKRSISHLAEIYVQDERPKLKAAIAQTFLRRTVDVEASVSDLAKKVLTDIWITPNLDAITDSTDSTRAIVIVQELVAHITQCLDYDLDPLTALFTQYLEWLVKATKNSTRLGGLLKRMADTLFQSVIEGKAMQASLQMLVCIAEAQPQRIVPQQLSHLRQYLKNIATEDDLLMFKCVVSIFRHVLPRLSSSPGTLLQDIQQDLFQSITRLARRTELDEVMSCLRLVSSVLDSNKRFARLLASVVNQLFGDGQKDETRTKLIRIVGSMGKHLDVDVIPLNDYANTYKGGSVAEFLAKAVYHHAAQGQTEGLQLVALESLGSICQAWPVLFNNQSIYDLFKKALAAMPRPQSAIDPAKAQKNVLSMFEEMFGALAALKDDKDNAQDDQLQDLKNMGGGAKAQDDNSATLTIANAIKNLLTSIALSGRLEISLSALRTITSISHCGLFHPRDYVSIFVALETSPDAEIRSVAEKAHALLHQHHETHVEREYSAAVQKAFTYQQSIARAGDDTDLWGVWQGRNYVPKISACFETVNTTSTKAKKFLSTLVSRMAIDFAKLDVDTRPIPDHLLFIRFVSHNIAFFDYARLEDLLNVINQLEKLFSKSGEEVSQAIQEQLPQRDRPTSSHANGEQPSEFLLNDVIPPAAEAGKGTPSTIANGASTALDAVDMTLLKRLSAAACAVTVLSETKSYLKRQYGISRNLNDAVKQAKDNREGAKIPMRIHGITGDKYLVNTAVVFISLTDDYNLRERLLGTCWEFVDHIAVDQDYQASGDVDDFRQSYSADVEQDVAQAPIRGRKRKSAPGGSAGGTPKKARGRPRKSVGNDSARRSRSVSSLEEDPEGDYWE